MKRSDLINIPAYYENYIGLVDDLHIKAALDKHLASFQNLNLQVLQELGDQTYAPGKWTVKEILQHIIDWERIFSYRAVVYARMDENRPMPHDENILAANSKANKRSISQLVDDFLFVRSSSISLFQSFDLEDLQKKAYSYENEISVAMIGYVMVGHQIHHFNVIKERYLPILGNEIQLLK